MTRRSTCAALFALVTLFATVARADEPPEDSPSDSSDVRPDNRARAQQLFDSALAAAEAGRYAEACPKFLASQEADPKTTTLLNLANCYEKNGQTASAWGAFREAEVRARKAARSDWEASAHSRAEALEARLVRLSIAVPPSQRASGLSVSRDGVRISSGEWGVAIPVDPGEHVVRASADGYQPFEKKVVIENKPLTTIEIPTLTAIEPPPPIAAPAPLPTTVQQPRRRFSPLELGGAITAASGVAALATGTVLGLIAKGQYDDARARCRDGARGCPSDAVADADTAYGTATGATIVFVAGAALVVGGALMYFFGSHRTAEPARASTPTVNVGLGGLAGSF